MKMTPKADSTELVIFNPMLLRIMPFVVVAPAAIDKDPEIKNITDPQIG